MHLFTEYVQPLTIWLHANPKWALLITFLISLAESLALIGSIVPGSVTMTAIGILAGSGIMRIDLTLLAGMLGAVAGDGASYLIGFTFSERLTTIWPFSRHPQWLLYGKEYFARHGAKSVLIGRFVGPLRSIIPVIAGMLRMPQWQFFFANVLSAIGWSILYIMPGVLIGAASTELAPENATHLIGLILLLLLLAWLISHALKWLFTYCHFWLRLQLHALWDWSGRHPTLTRWFNTLMPQYETNRYVTLVLILLLCFCILMAVAIGLSVLQTHWVALINNPVLFFLQSLRTYSIDSFFIIVNFMISPLALLAVFILVSLFTIINTDWRLFRYWLSLAFTSYLIAYFLNMNIHIPALTQPIHQTILPSFPARNLTIAMALLSFLILYARQQGRSLLFVVVQIFFALILVLTGIAIIYLGDNWLTSVLAAYFIGSSIALAHWIGYRRKAPLTTYRATLLLACILIIIVTGIKYFVDFNHQLSIHYPYARQYILSQQSWWHQQKPLLPLYSTNRLGKRIALLNLQYAGRLETFEKALTQHGWSKQPNSLFYSLLLRASGQEVNKELLSMTQLYMNKVPVLTMTYQDSNQPGIYILRLWRSNYHLFNYHQPIWLGSIIYSQPAMIQSRTSQHILFTYLLPAIQQFKYNFVDLTAVKTSTKTSIPKILIIKESFLD